MSYGISLKRDNGTVISFDGYYNNFRVVRTEIVEEQVGAQFIEDEANYNAKGPSPSAFSCARPLQPSVSGNYLLFRRYIGWRELALSQEQSIYYVTYKYLVCENSVSQPSGYGAVIYDDFGNVAFNSNDSYTRVYNISMRARYSEFNIPTPPAGMYSYCSVPFPGQLVYIQADFNGVEAFYQTVDVTSSKCLVGRGYQNSDDPTSESKAPHLYPSKSQAENASQSIRGSPNVQVVFAAYNE